MRTTPRSLLVIVGAIVVPLAFGQETPKPEEPTPAEEFLPPLPESRGELLELAMENNPDIVLARTQVREAEALLRKTQLEVAQELIEAAAKLETGRADLERVNQSFDSGHASSQTQLNQRRLQGGIAGLESRIRYLAGLDMPGVWHGPMHGLAPLMDAELVRVLRPSIAAVSGETGIPLDDGVTIDFYDEELGKALQQFGDSYSFNMLVDVDLPDETIDVNVRDIPLREALLALTDQCEFLCFVVRDYGILATTRERATRLPGPTIPEDIPLFMPASAVRNDQSSAQAELVPVPRPTKAASGDVEGILNSTVSVDFSDQDLRGSLEEISVYYDLGIVVDVDLPNPIVDVHVKKVPLREAFLALTDHCPSLCFVSRDYGLFATTRERAMRLSGATIPEDIPLLVSASVARDDPPPATVMLVPVPRPGNDAISAITGARLDSVISVKLSEVELREILRAVSRTAKLNIAVDMELPKQMVNVAITDVPLREALLSLTDQHDFLCFVVRDHDLFATTRDRAIRIPGPTIPEDIPLFVPVSSLEQKK